MLAMEWDSMQNSEPSYTLGQGPVMNGKVLLLTDDPETGQIWVHTLAQRGLEVVLVGSIEEALERRADEMFDMMVIDAYTAKLNDLEAIRRLRSEAANPIMLLTPTADETHVLLAYKAGADECVVKPISPPLFAAKVTAWLRRAWTVPARALDNLQVGGLQLVPARREVILSDGSVVKLANLEFRLLHLLMSHAGQVLDSDLIIDRVWGFADNEGDNTLLKNLVYRLRRKIEPDPSEPRYIQTVAGEGYMFQPEAEMLRQP